VTLARAQDGWTIEYEYDRPGRVVRRDVSGETAAYTYDERGSLLASRGSSGDTVEYTYDRDESLVAVARSDGSTRLAYDSLGRLVAVTDPRGETTAYSYDGAGHVLGVVLPDGDETVIQFEEGDPNRPIVIGHLYGGQRPSSLTLTATGRLLTCSDCP